MKKNVFILFLLCSLASFAQGEANVWYFGEKAGIDFNSGVPVALTDGQLDTLEGCATISNGAGQLLFYTDGITVWDKTHQIMPNGTNLNGNPSSSHAATIVPLPNSTTLYYVFTLDAFVGENGFCYSIVDMSLNDGNGAVTTKNTLIYTPSNEKISIVKHANNLDYWVVTHQWNSNNFMAHLLTSNGLSNNPVISSVGTFVSGSTDNVLGQMKISPDGTKLAICHNYIQVELFDFDVNTGVVSNPIVLFDTDYNYGVEFSPNSKVLYVSNKFTPPTNIEYKLLQFDLNANDIPSSVQTIYVSNLLSIKFWGIQLGPDGKVYVTQPHRPFLAVVNEPNIIGAGCDFQLDAINLQGRKCKLGLPPFVSSFLFTPVIQLQNDCVGVSTQFQLSNTSITSAYWDFGDGTISNELNPSHVYQNAGTYLVSVNTTSPVGAGFSTREIIISEVPIATQPLDVLICDDNNDGFYSFDLNTTKLSILNGQSEDQFNVRYFANLTDYTNHIIIENPTNFTNEVAFQAQTIIAEVYNLDNPNCSAMTSFSIQVFESPILYDNVFPIKKCDDDSFGDDADGRVVFNLTNNQSNVLNSQNVSNFQFSYFRDQNLNDLIPNPEAYINTNAWETIFVKVTNIQNSNCFAVGSFQIEVFSLPIINFAVSLKQCDDNNDGFSDFNLTEANQLSVANTSNLTFTYFESFLEAQNNSNPIANIFAYANQTVSTDQIFVRIENGNNCFRIASLNLIVSTTMIPTNFQRIFTVCDDMLSGSNTDGITTFDFSSVTSEIQNFYPVGQDLLITYYRNLVDALAEQNAILDISNYSNMNYPNTQDIFIRVDSLLDNECLGLGHHITLNVEALPTIQPLTFTECDDDHDGFFGFDTSNLESTLLNGFLNVTLSYWDSNNNLLPSPLPNPFITNSQQVKVRATNNTTNACFFETTIDFIVDDLPEAFPIPESFISVCDDEFDPLDQDGIYAFDTSTFESTILGGQSGMIVKYFDEMGHELSSPLPNPFISGSQDIIVKVINPMNTNCAANSVVHFVVKSTPKIQLNAEELICSNDLSFTKTLNAGLIDEATASNFSYQWYLDDSLINGATNYYLTVNNDGIYKCQVVNATGCEKIRTYNVTASSIAEIENVNISYLSNENAISIEVSGLGNYEYSIDGINFQTSNAFINLQSGFHTVFVHDINGCGIAQKDIGIIGIPKFFTPNNDGHNDFWKVNGISQLLNANTKIFVFDRYGQLLSDLKATNQGWDGTFNGNLLPSTDYWYQIILENGQQFKGHFSLMR